jgi:hypothetical protein
MKVCCYKDIGGHRVVSHITNATVDPKKTKERISPLIKEEMTEEEVKRIYDENLTYATLGQESEYITDETASEITEKLNAIVGKNQKLLANGEYLDDYRNTEYWIRKSNVWVKEKIERIGLSLPDGAVLQEHLSAEQQAEIAEQNETERIGSLSEQERAKEKDAKVRALAREAIMKEQEAELLGESFDKKAWLTPKKAELEKLYA